jgi:hypothetical protein
MSLIDKFHKEVGQLVEGDIWDKEYSEPKISDLDRKAFKESANRYPGPIRITKGLFYTSDEYERKREALLTIRIP